MLQEAMWHASELAPGQRSEDAVELYAGSPALSDGLTEAKLAVLAIDRDYCIAQDTATCSGAANGLSAVMKTKEVGLLWAAPQCSSWTWIGRAGNGPHSQQPSREHERAESPGRQPSAQYVASLAVLAASRNVYTAVEQPMSSLLPSFGPWPEMRAQLLPWTVTVHLGAYGASSPKPLQIVTNLPSSCS